MKLDSDDFELFATERRFAQSRSALDARWKFLQGEVHPDRFAAEGAAAKRVALQWAMRVNEAYERLKDPLKRAAYLCELNGAPIAAEDNTAMPPGFLVQQLEWREALDEASSKAELEALAGEVSGTREPSIAQGGRNQAGELHGHPTSNNPKRPDGRGYATKSSPTLRQKPGRTTCPT